MRKIILRVSAKTAGTNHNEACLVEDTMSDRELDHISFLCAIDNAESFGYQYVDDYSEDEYAWDNEVTADDLNYYWEDYDPEEHDMIRSGGGSFEDDFAELMKGYK